MKKNRLLAVAACSALLSLPAFAGDAEAGKQKAQPCEGCHGADGNSETPAFPRLAGQYQDYLLHVLQQYKSGKRENAIMSEIVSELSEQDLEDLAAYYARQEGLKNLQR